jgi:UDP-galactopyranose mutase
VGFGDGFDALVVGAGLSGSAAARHLAEKGKRVLLIERRSHIAGNMRDFRDGETGLLLQKYGPHTFHTSDRRLFDYMRRFSGWEAYTLACGAEIDGVCTPTPFNFKTIDDFYPPGRAAALKSRIRSHYGGAGKAAIADMLSSSDELIQEYAQFLFDKDYSLYTAKQWGISPGGIDASVLERVPVAFTYREAYFDDEFQAMPRLGFTAFFERMLGHPNIDVRLGVEAKDILRVGGGKAYFCGEPFSKPIIYTGALDELLGCKYGALPYRSLRFEWRTESTDSFQKYPVVAYPQADGYTRITEYSKLPVQPTNGKSVVAVEYPLQYEPSKGSEPYYPILTDANAAAYRRYLGEAGGIKNLYLCGRLADYKYYNMDQALERALQVCGTIEA